MRSKIGSIVVMLILLLSMISSVHAEDNYVITQSRLKVEVPQVVPIGGLLLATSATGPTAITNFSKLGVFYTGYDQERNLIHLLVIWIQGVDKAPIPAYELRIPLQGDGPTRFNLVLGQPSASIFASAWAIYNLPSVELEIQSIDDLWQLHMGPPQNLKVQIEKK